MPNESTQQQKPAAEPARAVRVGDAAYAVIHRDARLPKPFTVSIKTALDAVILFVWAKLPDDQRLAALRDAAEREAAFDTQPVDAVA